MPWLEVNLNDSIQNITAVDETGSSIEVDDSLLVDVIAHPLGHILFDYIGGVVVINQDRKFAYEFGLLKDDKLIELKAEAVARMRDQVLVENFDEVQLTREFWLSIAPAARNPTSAFQWVIDVYAAGVDAAVIVRAFTTEAEINNYDVTTDPSWPVSS